MGLRKENGQVLLVVILVVIITLTVGLSLASRSIVNLSASTEEAQSQKALSAAEAGIEKSLVSDSAVSDSFIVNSQVVSKYETSVAPIGGSTLPANVDVVLNGANSVSKDEGIDVWFQEHESGGDPADSFVVLGNPKLYWGSPSQNCLDIDNQPAAIQVIVLTVDAWPPTIRKTYRYAYDACDRENNFKTAVVGGTIDGTSFLNSTPNGDLALDIPLGEKVVFMRVVPIYKDTILAIKNDNALPSQGNVIDSTGTSGDASRKIRVFKGWPQTYLPYMSYGLFVAK